MSGLRLFRRLLALPSPVKLKQLSRVQPLSISASSSLLRSRKRSLWLGGCTLVAGISGYAAHLATPDWRQIVDSQHYYEDFQMRAYFSLPLNVFSRLAGKLANQDIPVWLRGPILGLFVKIYGCKMSEAEVSELSEYPTFASFFNRSLRRETRPISATPLVSPADGTVLHYGEVVDGQIEFIKGHDYSVREFLGDIDIPVKEGNALYQMVIYLAPGNYHAFHSPARWKAEHIRHYPGLLLSVRPSLLARVPHLFCLNERVVLNGHWVHGFFSMAAVAATNVGDVAIEDDPSIRTNLSRRRRDSLESVRTEFERPFLPGQKVGEFRLGSTIVLIFEAPKTVEFAIGAGDSLRYGQSLVVDL